MQSHSPHPPIEKAGQPVMPALPTWQDMEQGWWQAAEAALTLGHPNVVRDLCATMRAHRPLHLDARYYQARLALAEGDLGRAQPLLVQVLHADPEHWPARWTLGVLLLRQGDIAAGLARCYEAARRGSPWRTPDEQALWTAALPTLLAWGEAADEEPSEDNWHALLEAAQGLDSLSPAAGIARAQALLDRAPTLVKPRLLLAEWRAERGDVAESMSLLHDARVADPGGRVARRLRRAMLTIAFSTPLPPEVVAQLGQLPRAVRHAVWSGQVWQAPVALDPPRPSAKRTQAGALPSPQVQEIQRELERIERRLTRHVPARVRTALAPAEAIITARQPLLRLYGEAATDAILRELGTLADAVGASGTLRPHLLVADDPAARAAWSLPPTDNAHAATLKATLDGLEERLSERGERLAYVLLVGGHEIVPHHRLPNPVDDNDMDVPSDNPYATHGDNYLIPARAVGRLPHEHDSPDLLLSQIRTLQAAWREHALSGKGLWGNVWGTLLPWSPAPRTLPPGESLGMSAQVWERAAEEVFHTLDSRGALRVCPPDSAARWEEEPLPALPFYYFNLHGVENGGSWYGQAGAIQGMGTETFPVALTPAQVQGMALNRAVLFTESCYGANPQATRAADSIALSALRQGCSLYIGSTNTSYASFSPPLMAADLLAAFFWKGIAESLPGGVALQQAKLELAETLMRRTGFLEVEEQKTLTSFVLYGDPALPLLRRPPHADVEALRRLAAKATRSSVYQISSKAVPHSRLDPGLLQSVQAFARPYVLGSRDALTVRAHALSVTDAPPKAERATPPSPPEGTVQRRGAVAHHHP